ncbi:M15 family metallopeptidase [Acinetobacter seifertii]|uniref:M15 family metallopeptidase n=1 Tax=Acinetobacter seifertii TaxID=1530123 RepID=UPI001F06147C|nr:M15 family metallopeptidase [Acinetobacter seifertii]MCH2002093.1 M15 family metallopeptidase [Acinetobacter seifertii]
MSYSEEFIKFVGTVAGEAGGCSPTTWKVVAHCIKNRIGFAEWINARNISDILKKNFDAISDKNPPFKKAVTEMHSGNISDHTQDIIDVISPIYQGLEEDITNGVVLYYSPKAQAALHKKNPEKYTSLVPDFAKSPLTQEVKIKGTENDDMRWYRYKGTSRFYVQFVDKSANVLVKSSVSIGYKKTKVVPALSNLVTDNQGKIRSFLVKDGWGARFTIDGVQAVDNNNKEILLIADGKNHSSVIVVASGRSGIKSQTDIHNQQTSPSQKQESVKKDTKVEVNNEKKAEEGENNTKQKNVNFSIKIIDSENKVIPNFSYFLKYKNAEKKHSVGTNGIENNLVALSGEEITVLISGLDSKQEIIRFTAQEGMGEKTIKLNLHTFNILFRHRDTKKPITNLNLIQKYRNQIKQKKTDGNGKITVSAMPGFELNYKLRDERNLLTIKVDKNKSLRVIDVDSSAIEQASKNIKTGTKVVEIPTSKQPAPSSKHKQPIDKPVETHDSTPKRDEKVKTSTEGHPKTIVIDNSDIEFKILTYDKISKQLVSNCEYIIEYKGNKNSHISGVSGLGAKIHKGQAGQTIKIFENTNLLTQVVLQKDMKPISINVTKSDSSQLKFSGVDWCSLFLQSNSLSDLAEPFRTNATKFINGMKNAGIGVVINTTWRPDKRSYLMYYSTAIARGEIAVDKVPRFPGVNIDWTHNGNKTEAVKAAKAMYQKYGIGKNPVGKPGSSNHNSKMAVDMRISNYVGKVVVIDGESTKITSWATLTQLGKKHGVIWYGSKDTPHWSHTGR